MNEIVFKSMSATKAFFHGQFSSDPSQNIEVKCPTCDFELVHIESMRTISGEDRYKASWNGRGDLHVIVFEGECGHHFEVCFGFHKGTTVVFCRTVEDV